MSFTYLEHMHCQAYHLWRASQAFRVQRIERRLQILIELLRREAASRAVELQVVVVVPGTCN